MADSLLFTPTKPHFFQPLLPGFHHQLMIPVSFFKYLGGQKLESAMLKSSGCERTWKVRIDGRRITQGWEEFVDALLLQVGDIIVFRYEGDMLFQVTAFDSSGCQRQYAPFHGVKQENASASDDGGDDAEEEEEEEEEEDTREAPRKNIVKNRSRRKAAALDNASYLATVTPSSINTDMLHIPSKFVRSNGLHNRCCKIIIRNKQGRSWTMDFRYNRRDGRGRIRGGWRDFCAENELKAGASVKFKLVWSEKIPVLKLVPSSSDELSKTGETKKPSKARVTSCARQDSRFVTLTVSPSSLNNSPMRFPMWFARANGLQNKRVEITLIDKDDKPWPSQLWTDKSNGRVCFSRSWKRFCITNGLKAGESFRLEIIRGEKLALKFCYKVKAE